MLCRKFELIPIKIGFFMNFFKLLKNLAKDPVLIVQDHWPIFAEND